MTHITPCTRCPLSFGCTQRDEFRRRARGLRAVSVRFRCPILTKEVRPGRRIIIRMPVARYTGHAEAEEYEICHVEVPATITAARKDHSFSCVVDKTAYQEAMEDSAGLDDKTSPEFDVRRFRKTQKHVRIVSFSDFPDGKICESGNRLLDDGECDRHPNDREGRCPCAYLRMMESP